MEKCENCNKEHNGLYGSGRFCSSKCARSFSTKEKRKDINLRVSKKLLGKKTRNYSSSGKMGDRKSKIKPEYINVTPEERWGIINEKRKKNWVEKLMSADYSSLSFERLKMRIVLEQNEKCNKCDLSEWFGEKLPLELEHIDGNHHNNTRNNLEALCPNCHSLTPTWRGRNKKNCNRGKVSDEKLFEMLLKNNFNMRQSLLSVGLAAKGGNYKRCHQLKREFEELSMEMLGAGIPKSL